MHRSRYSERVRVVAKPEGHSLAKQAFRDQCDIRNIIKKYRKTGVVSHVRTREGIYGDFSDIGDYQSALNAVIKAENMFMELPAAVREKFGNDPGAFVKFAEKPENYDELVKLGLAEPRKKDVSAASKPKEDPKPQGSGDGSSGGITGG